MVERSDLKTVESGDEFVWQCPQCDTTFTRMVGKGVVMSLRTRGYVSLPCPNCEDIVELALTDLVDIRDQRPSEYDAADHYHT